jgi:hypothetical protein
MKTNYGFKKIVESGSLTAAVFGFFGWLYIVVVRFVSPETLTIQLSHLTPWLREDTFGMICFVVSGIGFFVWNILKDR